jgi:phosphoribosyl 1,2-cyclic phosphodiesterase
MTVSRPPAIQVQTLASGSSGNMAVVRCNGTTIALDLGISSQRGTRAALESAGLEPRDLAAVLVSHSHSDHLNYSGLRVAVEAQVPVLAGAATLRKAADLYRTQLGHGLPHGSTQEIRAGDTYLVRGVEVTPFSVPHDVPTFGFELRVTTPGGVRRLAIATDLGCAPDDLVPHFADADAILIEANYNDDLLAASPRHPEDKARVASDEGHLSNVQAGHFLRRVAQASERLPRAIVLVHLSKDHNRPSLAVDEVTGATRLRGSLPQLTTAPRGVPGPRIDL